jgi:hypothetical protein
VLFLVHRFLSPWWRRRQVPPKRRFLQEPHGVTTQKTPLLKGTEFPSRDAQPKLHVCYVCTSAPDVDMLQLASQAFALLLTVIQRSREHLMILLQESATVNIPISICNRTRPPSLTHCIDVKIKATDMFRVRFVRCDFGQAVNMSQNTNAGPLIYSWCRLRPQ